MSSRGETENEILLGNRHLLAIFFVLAVLLGIAFTGGYMVGHNSTDKRTVAAAGTDVAPPTTSGASSSLNTHELPAAADGADASTKADDSGAAITQQVAPPPPVEEHPLGEKRKPEPVATAAQAPPPPALHRPEPKPKPAAAFAGPQSGQSFLQVTAVGRTEAIALANVLSKKGFNAHAVAKPGSSDVYRVLVGPLADASDLSSTRESLRNAGFSKIFVQRY